VVKLPADGSSQVSLGNGLSAPGAISAFAPAPVFTADSPPDIAPLGLPYSYTYKSKKATGEPQSSFKVISGSLPPGLKLNRSTGVLSGAPTLQGTFTFQVEVENFAAGTISPATTIDVN
jgi:hypothetical protein